MFSGASAEDDIVTSAAELAAGREWWLRLQKAGTVAWRAAENVDGILSTDAHQHYDLASQALVRVRYRSSG
jgi:hypothetical protein